jgi:hypothetical protein
MSARIDIVNIALSLLGADSITSLEDDAPEAKIMKTHYYIARDATMEAHEWSFAIQRFKPAESVDDPLWGWSNSFTIPSDIMRVLQVDRNFTAAAISFNTSADMHRDQVAHVIESGKILCNEGTIYCTGIRRVEDEGIYSALFAHAFAAKLAMLACHALTESTTKFEAMAALYTQAIQEAKSRDGQQGTTRRLRHHQMRRSRG